MNRFCVARTRTGSSLTGLTVFPSRNRLVNDPEGMHLTTRKLTLLRLQHLNNVVTPGRVRPVEPRVLVCRWCSPVLVPAMLECSVPTVILWLSRTLQFP